MDQAVELLEQTRKMRLGVDLVLPIGLAKTRFGNWRFAQFVLD